MLTTEDKQTIAKALQNLTALVYELEPDAEYSEMLGVAQVIEEAQTAYEILTKSGEVK